MGRPSQDELFDRVWLRWECLRRNPAFRKQYARLRRAGGMLEPDGEFLMPSFGAPAKVVARYRRLCEQFGLLFFPNPYIDADRGLANAPLFIDFPPLQVRARDEIALRGYVKRLMEDAPEISERQMRRLFTPRVRVTLKGFQLKGRARIDWQLVPACLRVWDARHPASSEPLPVWAVARNEGISEKTVRRRYRLACAVIGMSFSGTPPSDEEIRAHLAVCATCLSGRRCRWLERALALARPHLLKGSRRGIEDISEEQVVG